MNREDKVVVAGLVLLIAIIVAPIVVSVFDSYIAGIIALWSFLALPTVALLIVVISDSSNEE